MSTVRQAKIRNSQSNKHKTQNQVSTNRSSSGNRFFSLQLFSGFLFLFCSEIQLLSLKPSAIYLSTLSGSSAILHVMLLLEGVARVNILVLKARSEIPAQPSVQGQWVSSVLCFSHSSGRGAVPKISAELHKTELSKSRLACHENAHGWLAHSQFAALGVWTLGLCAVHCLETVQTRC